MKLNIINKIYREKDIENINNKIKLLGDNTSIKSAEYFLTLRVVTLILLLVGLILLDVKYILIPFILIVYYNLFYYYFITLSIKKRARKLEKEALMFFEVLTLTLESGKNLFNSLQITCYNIDSELSREFENSLNNVKYGKSLMEALKDLCSRMPSEDIKNIIINIMQTSVFGNNITITMNNQIEFLREKQIMEVKAQINKIPNKVSVISVVFIIPLILLIILGPFIIKLL